MGVPGIDFDVTSTEARMDRLETMVSALLQVLNGDTSQAARTLAQYFSGSREMFDWKTLIGNIALDRTSIANLVSALKAGDTNGDQITTLRDISTNSIGIIRSRIDLHTDLIFNTIPSFGLSGDITLPVGDKSALYTELNEIRSIQDDLDSRYRLLYDRMQDLSSYIDQHIEMLSGSLESHRSYSAQESISLREQLYGLSEEARGQITDLYQSIFNCEAKLAYCERHIDELNVFVGSYPNQVQSQLEEAKRRTDEVKFELHDYLIAESLGLSTGDVPLPRFLPVEVYLGEEDNAVIKRVSDAVQDLIELEGFRIADDFPPERGSWWKRWWVSTTTLMTRQEVKDKTTELLEKAQMAAELRGIDTPQSEVDVKKADAISKVLGSIGENNAIVKIGSLIVIRTLGKDNKTATIITDLTTEQMILLKKKPGLLRNPKALLDALDGCDLMTDNAIPATTLTVKKSLSGTGTER